MTSGGRPSREQVAATARRGLAAVAYIGVHPVRMVKLAASFVAADGFATARNLPRDVVVDTGFALMQDHDVVEVSFRQRDQSWRTDVGDDIGLSLWRSGQYQGADVDGVVRWLRSAGRAEGTVVDVGANIGTTSVPFARAGYQVLAIEPVPRTFSMLCTNISTNELEGSITAINSAVGLTSAPVQMWTGFATGQAEVAVEGEDPTITRFGGSRGELVDVSCARLDDLIAEASVPLPSIALVWSDVQGSELRVVQSAPAAWAAGVPLYLEVDPLSLELHGGVDTFVATVTEQFSSFVGRDDIAAGRALRPIDQFAGFVAAIPTASYTDALLVP